MKLFKSSRLIAVNNILFQTDFQVERVHTESDKVLKSAQQFSDLEKVWKIAKKSEKNCKKYFW